MTLDTDRPGFDCRMSREEINQMPIRGFTGKIHLIKTLAQMDTAIEELNKETILGFDTETRPAYKKGESYLPSLLQIAGSKAVYLFQLKHLKFPQSIRKLLANPRIVKAGVATSFDILQLKELGGFKEAGFVELADIAKYMGIKNHGLRGMAAVLLNFRISKGARQSNWAKDELAENQMRYAATDAWVGRELYICYQDMGVI